MKNNFEFAFKNKSKWCWSISTLVASQIIKDYNVYFNFYAPELPWEIQDLDFYKLDNARSFDEQIDKIKRINFPYENRIFFYTDHKQNETILRMKINEAKLNLLGKKQSLSLTNIVNLTKLKKEDIKKVFEDDDKKVQPVFQF
jgi:hypothetical protein